MIGSDTIEKPKTFKSPEPSHKDSGNVEHGELEMLAIMAITDLKKLIANIPADQVPAELATALSNLASALQNLQNTPRNAPVPATVRNAIQNSVKIVSIHQHEHENESSGTSHDRLAKIHDVEKQHQVEKRIESRKIAAEHIQELTKTPEQSQTGKTIAHDLQQDFADHSPRVTKDGHAVLSKEKQGKFVGKRAEEHAKQVNTVAQLANKVGLLDDHAAQTAARLAELATTGTEAQKEAARGEQSDAIARRFAGDTFYWQEIRDAQDQLHDANNKSISKDQALRMLKKNGWTTEGYEILNGYEKNAQWSHRNVKRLDFNHDGQLSAAEIQFGLDHKKSDYDKLLQDIKNSGQTLNQAEITHDGGSHDDRRQYGAIANQVGYKAAGGIKAGGRY